MRCEEVRDLTARCPQDGLPPDLQRQVAAHLTGCPGCAAGLDEEEWLFGLIDTAAPQAAPDLWPAFSRRLAATVPCEQVRGRLPEYVDSSTAPESPLPAAVHLEQCRECRSELEAYSQALTALENSRVEEVDLWPAFQRRLNASTPAPPWMLIAPLFRLARPAAAVAAAAALALFLMGRDSEQVALSPARPAIEAEPAAPPSVAPAPPVIPQPSKASASIRESRPQRVAPSTSRGRVRHEIRRKLRPARPAAAKAPAPRETPSTLAGRAAPAAAQPSWSVRLAVQYPGVSDVSGPVTAEEKGEVAAELVQAMDLLADAGQAPSEVFE